MKEPMTIPEIHALLETFINYSPDSSLVLIDLASAKIDQLTDEELALNYRAENNLRKADYWRTRNLDASKLYLKKAHAYYKQHADNKKLAEIYVQKGQIIKNEGRISQHALNNALPYFDTALVYAQRCDIPALTSFVYFEKAYSLQQADRWPESFENAFECMNYAEESKDSLTIASACFLMGRNYHHFGLFNSSESYISKSIGYGKGMSQIYFIIETYGDILLQNGKDELAMANYEHALQLALEKNDTNMAISIYTNIGQNKLNKGDIKGAEAIYYEMSDLLKPTKNIGSRTLLFSAQMHHHLGDNELAIQGLERFMSKYNNTNVRPRNIDVYKGAADLCAALGQTNESAIFYKKWGTLKDSLYRYTSQFQMTDLEKMYLNERNKNEELRVSRQQQATLGGVLILIILIGGGLLYYIRLKGIRENQALKQSLAAKQMEQMLDAQETERQRLARELHDGIGQSLAALKMQLQFNKSPKALDATAQHLDNICNEVRSLSHQMMPIVLKENGLQSAVEQLIKHNFSASSIEVDFVHFGLQRRLTDNIEVNVYRITQELVSNILRHSKASKVTIQLLKGEKKLVLIVEDDGRGFNNPGKAQGIGLSNINVRLEALGGKVQIQSSDGNGTYIHISIPTNSDENKKTA